MDITSFAVGYQKGLNEGGSGSSVTVEPITITENGKKTAPSGRAYSPVTVNVQPDLETLTATENGTYTPTGDGYSQVTVDVQGAVVQPLSVTQNGTYTPPSGVDGYAPVTVNVSGGVPSVKLKIGQSNPVVEASGIFGNMSNNSTDYIVPILSDGSFAKLDLSQPFEICCKFKLQTAPRSEGRNIWGSSNSYYHCPTIAVFDNKIGIYITTNGSSWNAASAEAITPSGYSFPLNTWITATMAWDGTDFSITVNDGNDIYTATKSNITPFYNSGYSFEFGGQNKSQYSISGYGASIDLSHTYLKQGNTIIWGRNT